MASERPNILILLADQHRYDCLGCYGNGQIRTPNLDALADEGLVFDHYFCTYPVCTPSRYSLLTGLHVHQHLGATNNVTLHPGLDTFPRLLAEAGYHTKAVGKMHYHPTYLDVGFQEMVLSEQDGPGRWDDDYHRYLRSKGLADKVDMWDQLWQYHKQAPPSHFAELGSQESDLPEAEYSTTWIADRAMETLDAWQGGGNLLMTGFIKPHHPFDAPAPWSELYNPDELSPLPGWLEEPLSRETARSPGYYPHETMTLPMLQRVMAQYYASITQIDFHIGRMVELLRERGLYENTLIVYTADHGEYMGFHHLLLKANYMYDPLIKAPLVMKLPGGARAGERPDALASGIDLAPTILAQAGVLPGQWMRGLDLSQQEASRDHVCASAYGGGEYMIRTRERKLLLTPRPESSLLFDLAADPLERTNLYNAPERQSEVQNLTNRLARWLMFEAPYPHCAFDRAPAIEGPNVPDMSDGHAADAQSYFLPKAFSNLD